MTEQLSLIPEKLFSPKDRKVVLDDLPTDLLGPDPDPAFIESVRNVGVLQSIGLLEKDGGYIVGWGRRRIKAARIAGRISIPAKIFPQGSISPAILTLIENRHRSDNLPAQLDAIATLRLTATPEEICAAVGMSQQELTQAIKLLDGLAPELRVAMGEGRMKATTAKQAAKLPVEQQRELAERETIKSKDVAVLQRQQPTVEQTANLLQPVEINYGDRIRGKTLEGEMLEGIADQVGHKYVRLSTGEALTVETVELLKAEGGLAELETLENAGEPFVEAPSDPVSEKVSKQSWKLQAKPLIEQLLAVVPEGEDIREYLEVVANSLKGKN
jgi:ParB-like chromosome segregation protein Spo0J